MVEKNAAFTTSIHVLVSAVQKLAAAIKLPDGLKLYRGLGGVIDLPEGFFRAHDNGGRGFTEWGFMSTTSDKQVARWGDRGVTAHGARADCECSGQRRMHHGAVAISERSRVPLAALQVPQNVFLYIMCT